MEIAVLVNESKTTSGFDKDGTILVYEKEGCNWKISRQLQFKIDNLTSATILHHKIKEISEWLNDCRIIVVDRIRGVHYIAFEEFQISMLQIKGKPEQFLDDIKECVNHQRTISEVPLEHKTIYESQSGKFYTDLRDVMNGKTSYSSKQILLPFIKKETYQVLEIQCDHVPKWLEKEQTELKIRFTVEQYRDCIKVKIYPKSQSSLSESGGIKNEY